MDSIGNDHEIRALFSELRFADETAAPGFAATWQRAQARQLQPRRAFKLSLVAATALMVFALVTLAVWSNYRRPAAPVFAYAIVPATADFAVPRVQESTGSQVNITAGKVNRPPLKTHRPRPAASSAAIEMASTRQALKTIESWQSPTASLLSSPSDDIFKSLPQLNENANGMKSFLPSRANDKEK